MDQTRLGPSQVFLLTLPAVVGGVIITLLLQSPSRAAYAAAVGAIVGLTYGFAGPGLLAEAIVEARALHAALIERAKSLGIALSNRLDRRAGKASITVTGAAGVCPLGFKPGDRWRVSQSGRLNRPLCTPAIAGIAAGNPKASHAGGIARCVCPLGVQSLTLKVTGA
jgi:hypothetical protein